ncbi:MAG: AAA family ATPase [Gemmatimonadota bacterium]|nr:AAA family ATPase [Gemmatimonadota bacterium]
MAADPRPQLRAIRLRAPPRDGETRFPHDLPSLQGVSELELSPTVTVFAGENGSGKSTLLEAMALEARLPTVGSVEASRDASLVQQRQLSELLTLVWNRRTHRGFFLRAEDFFGFSRRVKNLKSEMAQRLEDIDRDYEGRSDYAKVLARGPAAGSIRALEDRYGEDPDAQSHGESFLSLFRSRFVPDGLYLLDEPEAALSPQSQLGLVALMKDMVDQGCQFIMATHSPILAAIPGATLYDFSEEPVSRRVYDDLEGVRLLRDFLARPDGFLRHIWPADRPD